MQKRSLVKGLGRYMRTLTQISSVCLTLLSSSALHAQGKTYDGYSSALVTAPTTASISGSSGSSVNHASGTIQQQIPLYQIQQNGIQWPIALNYHYSGLQVMEAPSSIGLGWSISGGGFITREVRGLPDDHPKGYHGSEGFKATVLDPYQNATGDRQILKEYHAYLLAQGLADGEPDVFHLQAGGLRVSFKLDDNLNPILLSHHNVKIEFSWEEIIVTDAHGARYIFDVKETIAPQPEEGLTADDPLAPASDRPAYTRSWFLSEIQPVNTSRSITFSYDTQEVHTYGFAPKIYSYKAMQSEFLIGLQNVGGPNTTTGGSVPDYIATLSNAEGTTQDHSSISLDPDSFVYTHTRLPLHITMPVLKTIAFAQGSVNYQNATVATGDYPVYTGVALKNVHQQRIKSYTFETTGARRLLTAIQENGTYAYGFEYYRAADVIPFVHDAREVPYLMDYWGYYKDATSLQDVLRNPGAQYPYFEGTLIGALQHINHRTGGQTTVYYEPNTYAIPFTIDNSLPTHEEWIDHGNIGITVKGTENYGRAQTKTVVQEFTVPTTVTIRHSGTITAYGAALEMQIKKEGYDGDYIPYTQCERNAGVPQLNINRKGTANYPEGQLQYQTVGSCSFTITPGTYSFSVTATAGAEGSISLSYDNNPITHTKAIEQAYGGLRVQRIESCATDTQSCVSKAYRYTDAIGMSSAKIRSILNTPPRWYEYQSQNHHLLRKDIPNDRRKQYYPFYVSGRGLPIYYSRVAVTQENTDINAEETSGTTVYSFDSPTVFDTQGDIHTQSYYDRAPVGQHESGILTTKVEHYKDLPEALGQFKKQLVKTQDYIYTKVALDRDAYGNAHALTYPYGMKVISKKQFKRPVHYDRWIPFQMQLSHINMPPPIALLDFEEYYKERTQEEFETYAQGLITAGGFEQGNTPQRAHLLRMARPVRDISTENDPDKRHDYYTVINYKDTNVQYVLTQTIDRTYDDYDASIFYENTSYSTYNEYNQLTRQERQNAKGETMSVRYHYPYEDAYEDTQLVNIHRIGAPVFTENYYQGDLQHSTQLQYFADTQESYRLQKAKETKATHETVDQTVYYRYDTYGNPLETSLRDGVHTLYIWGYQGSLPIAVIANASYQGMPQEVKDLIASAQERSNQDRDAASEQALRNALNAIRAHTYFKDAQCMTYTYDPLIGITSQQDIRGRNTFYHYDQLQRLVLVKDQEGNIITENQYQYQR